MDKPNNMLDFSVVIPTYNGAQRLPRLLECLKKQVLVEAIRWEILIVDNNSNDTTFQAVCNYQKKWDNPFPLRYFFEGQQGAGYARKTGIEQSQGDIVGFLDDDNYPKIDWVYRAYSFAKLHKRAGAWGSTIHGDYEVEPPEGWEKLQCYLAIIERGDKAFIYDPKTRLLPPSAGLVVRKQAWLETVPEKCILNGRVGDSMLACEDLEVLSYIQRKWDIWHHPNMVIDHYIPQSRIEKEYLIKLMKGIGLSRYVTRTINLNWWQRHFYFLFFLNDLRQLVLLVFKSRFKVNELDSQCKMHLYLASLQSYFYLKKQGLLYGRRISLFKSQKNSN